MIPVTSYLNSSHLYLMVLPIFLLRVILLYNQVIYFCLPSLKISLLVRWVCSITFMVVWNIMGGWDAWLYLKGLELYEPCHLTPSLFSLPVLFVILLGGYRELITGAYVEVKVKAGYQFHIYSCSIHQILSS